jgi:hypothetical protein
MKLRKTKPLVENELTGSIISVLVDTAVSQGVVIVVGVEDPKRYFDT